ncbi:MAG: serine/threonine protein kinase [Verrucomicrobiae bacterium]|nr:serine/threonine protein kinase [Verrucomicrobiae bacterium]
MSPERTVKLSTTAPSLRPAEAPMISATLRSGFRYRLIRPLGEGGAGRTFLAHEYDSIGTFRPVAIKMLHTPEDEGFQKTFMLEARLMRLMDHPNILAVFGFEKGSSHFERALAALGLVDSFESFMVMEYIHGYNLAGFVRAHADRGILCHPYLAADLIARVARGLAYAHDFRYPGLSVHGIVHRDVSPNNVLLHENGRLKVTDFGIAYPFNPTSPGPRLMGTPEYIAPEVLAGCKPTPLSDVYSAGLLLEFLLTGASRFVLGEVRTPREMVKALQTRIRRHAFSAKTFAGVSPRLVEICRNATAPRPEVRYQSATDLALDLEIHLRENGSSIGPRQAEVYIECVRSLDPGKFRSRELIPVAGRDFLDFRPARS